VIFLNSARSAAALVFYLPGVCTLTDTEGKTEKGKSPEYFKIFEKNTIFNEHPVGYYFIHNLAPRRRTVSNCDENCASRDPKQSFASAINSSTTFLARSGFFSFIVW